MYDLHSVRKLIVHSLAPTRALLLCTLLLGSTFGLSTGFTSAQGFCRISAQNVPGIHLSDNNLKNTSPQGHSTQPNNTNTQNSKGQLDDGSQHGQTSLRTDDCQPDQSNQQSKQHNHNTQDKHKNQHNHKNQHGQNNQHNRVNHLPRPVSVPPVPVSVPRVPSGAPSVPSGAPSVPSGAPSVPSSAPSVPSSAPSVPSGAPSVPVNSFPRLPLTGSDPYATPQ